MRKPWVAHVDPRRYLWLEHYPRRKPDHVLNAHLHAIFGIYEYWQVDTLRCCKAGPSRRHHDAVRQRLALPTSKQDQPVRAAYPQLHLQVPRDPYLAVPFARANQRRRLLQQGRQGHDSGPSPDRLRGGAPGGRQQEHRRTAPPTQADVTGCGATTARSRSLTTGYILTVWNADT